MANPITFTPPPVDPHVELMRKVEAAPREHAEALLVAWDTLQTAHDQGVLDLLQGLMGGRDVIAGKLAGAIVHAGIHQRNSQSDCLGKYSGRHRSGHAAPAREGNGQGMQGPKADSQTPSMFRILRQATSPAGKRGLSFAVQLLVALGTATEG